jgi:hypothetical protein
MPGWVKTANPVWILEGQALVAVLESDSYALAYLSPGEHWLRSWNTAAPPENYWRDCFDFEKGRAYYVLLYRDGSMAVAPSDSELNRLLAASPDLQQREVSPELAAIARRPLQEFPAAGEPPGQTQPAEPARPSGEKGVVVPSGTQIPLRLIENANSFNTKAGEPLLFEVEEEVLIGDEVVVPAGILVEGIVRNTARPGMAGQPGLVEVEIFKLVLPSGEVLPLQGFVSSAGRPSGAANTLGKVGEAGLQETFGNADPFGLALTLLAMMALAAVRGHDAWVPAGLQLQAVVRRDTRLNPGERLGPQEAGPLPTGAPVAASSMGPIVVPDSARVTGPWCVRLETPSPPLQVWITSVGDLPPPRTIQSSKIESHGPWQEIQFPAWPVARFAVLGPSGPAAIAVVLEGTLADGSAFFATVQATVRTASQH